MLQSIPFVEIPTILTYMLPALLPTLHPDKRDQLQQHLHLPRSSRAVEGGSGNPVRELWLSGMF